MTFAAVEEYGARPSATAPAGFPKLRDPSPVEWALLKRYDTEPFVPGTGTLPFVDVDNRLVVSGSGIGFSPGVLQGKSMGQIADDLAQPSNADTQAILGAANKLTAAICAATGGKPAAVCASAGVRAGAGQPRPALSLGRRRASAGAALEDLLALVLVQAAPDAVGLTDPDGVLEAVLLDDTGRADVLGAVLPLDLVFFALGMRGREEDRRLRSPAGRPSLPSLPQSSSLHSPS